MSTMIVERADRWSWRVRASVALVLTVAVCASVLVLPTPRAEAVTDPTPSFEVIPSDLEFILKQIKISESHAAGNPLLCASTQDTSGTCVPSPFLPWGLRTVDGSSNNLLPGRTDFGAADRPFPRMLPTDLRPGVGEAAPPGAPQVPGATAVCQGEFSTPTCYRQTSGFVYDSHPRVVSNLIVDLTDENPAAVAVAEKVEGSEIDEDGRIFIPNESPDEGLSAPFNTWMTFFGQFFDHGLDLVNKGGSGTVVVPLRADDPLYDPASRTNFLMLTRATNQPGPDGQLGTADDVRDHNNQTTPFVDQNQTYTSHASHQVFLREYTADGNDTGGLLNGGDGGLATWADIKEQAASVLGVELVDRDVLNVPLLLTDPYGNFIPGDDGKIQFALDTDPVTYVEADGGQVPTNALRTGHAFLDDIAHAANPSTVPHDGALLDAHFITGDGRGNENIGLTAVHHIFHAEHNRVADHIEDVLDENPTLRDRFRNEGEDYRWDYGQRLFQAARYVTEMEYQHLVFEEFGRTLAPFIDAAPLNESTYHLNLDAAVTAEFAHVVYRFGHSMLTETVHRDGYGATDLSLLEAFLNPHEFTMDGALTPEEAAGSIVNGMVASPGSGIDEFVTETLRNELLGLPLDLATINMMRGRDTGVPPLQEARRRFHAVTGDTDLAPYSDWEDFGEAMKNPESLVNFIAAYGTHASVTAEDTIAGKRLAAQALVDGNDAFLRAPAATSGLDTVDFWMGGLAEANVPFAGFLGTTFNYVFETQLENLQNGDRFYYLSRNIGLNLFHQLEANSFSSLIMRTTDASNLPAEIFATPDHTFDLNLQGDPDVVAGWAAAGFTRNGDPNPLWRYRGGAHINVHGTVGMDRIQSGIGDDALWGSDEADHIRGGAGADSIVGGRGNDILYGEGDDDNVKGGAGNDAMHGGSGEDLLLGGSGSDYIVHGSDITQSFGGTGSDIIRGGAAHDIIAGNEGDDWLEGGGGADLVQGDNSNGFQDDPNGGHDVLWGGSGNDDMDAEGGDDVMIGSLGSDRYEGMLGFDWVTHRGVPEGAMADMDNTVFQPPSTGNFRSRYDLVEAVSGWDHDDVLRGVGANDENDGAGHELTPEHLDRVEGMRDLLGGGANPPHAAPFLTANNLNNIILGGDGSDILEGRGGDDFLDGSAWLNVQLQAPTLDGQGVERHDSMATLQARVFNGELDPGDISIVRQIVAADEPDAINTAVFSDDRASYDVSENADGTLRVAHARGLGGPAGDGAVGEFAGDGTDTLRNVQRLQFADQVLDLTGSNTPAEGQPIITGLPATQGTELGVDLREVTDADGIDTATLSYEWQVESDVEADVWGPIATAADQDTFTPTIDEVGRRLRLVVTFNDGDGALESVTSEPTEPVIGDGEPVPVIEVDPGEVRFGAQTVGTTSASQDVTIANVGDGPLVVGDVTVTGDQAARFPVTDDCATVAPGTSCTVRVSFAPTAVGAVSAAVEVTHNAAGSPSSIEVSGEGVAAAPRPTATIQGGTNFGNRPVGSTRDQAVRLQNDGPGQLAISNIAVTGTGFSLLNHNCPASLPLRGRCDITIRFSPPAAGAHTGQLSVVSNASNSPTSLTLTGNGR